MKIPPINNIKQELKKMVKNSIYRDTKPIKNYSQYLKEYGLKK